MKKLILASTSPRRKELLTQTGIPFEIVASSYEEDMTLELSPAELVKHLSLSKARAVAEKVQDAVVVGADTIVVFENKIIGKPHTNEKAKETLQGLNGKQHSVFTGFTVMDADTKKFVSKSAETKIYFKNNSEKEIDAYVATGEPLDKAGAYAIQGLGGKLIDRIEGDHSSVIGLPITKVLEVLKDFGINI